MTTDDQVTDWRGSPIVGGSLVIYPGRQGSAQWITEARVVEVGPKATRVLRLRQYLYRLRTVEPKEVTVATENLTVVGVADAV
ncbi:hypothetical protein [Parafrankia sp. EUN1f]|uniref:hypothetical protein n=1 Tax=Parafrankia sp. EUN1f TaxID=102897 RepID=UPI0001C4599D|nr:hypothetical protein [Parafrankia sp. EUN1f]EFC86484.1 hypothetical protein FrEUN1fDRAFT_0379 [Parafrankia sp. EUN1f]